MSAGTGTSAARPLHIALAGPVATADIEALLPGRGPWPPGSPGAPLLATLVVELLRRGHRVSVVTLSNELPLRGPRRPGARVSVQHGGFGITWCPARPKVWPWLHHGTAAWMPGRGWDGSRFERAHLRAALLALRPQIVHAHWAYEYALAALRSGGPHLVSCHDLPHEVTAEQTLWRSRLWRWLCERQAARVMKRARALTAPSPWLAEALTGQARVPVTVLPNMVSMGPADAAPAERPRPLAGRWRVLMANNGFGLRKNVGAGLEAFARLARQRPGAELVLLGEDMGPGQAAERWWRARGLDAGRGHVRFVGAQSHAVVQHWMRQSDVLLHPALQETFGMAVAEALALGLPVVAGHASGALPWLAGELAGTQVRLVDVRSPEAMAEALQALALGRESDPARAAAWSAAAQRSMRERFAPPRVGDALEALYRQALAEQG